MIEVFSVTGESLQPYLPEAARLRMKVFREYPYLYDGTEEYERAYLATYGASRNAVIVLAVRDGRVVGVSTGLPLAEADEAFQKPFLDAGWDVSGVFYFGESVLAKNERGQGIGHRFFDEREKHAAELGYATTAFCAVERPEDHPLKPAYHRPNDAFWTKRGYRKIPELHAELEWRQVDRGETEVNNRLVFWVKGGIPTS
ncbi:MAG: N-acetyltransferase [Verrucomicrobiaceae bacterium]|nr:MAG: N-acetyltransferase [Verrucomicrobiaceae bacterium]